MPSLAVGLLLSLLRFRIIEFSKVSKQMTMPYGKAKSSLNLAGRLKPSFWGCFCRWCTSYSSTQRRAKVSQSFAEDFTYGGLWFLRGVESISRTLWRGLRATQAEDNSVWKTLPDHGDHRPPGTKKCNVGNYRLWVILILIISSTSIHNPYFHWQAIVGYTMKPIFSIEISVSII